MFKRLFALALMGLAMLPSVQAKDEGYPGRAKFPEIKTIEKADLVAKIDQFLIVDARSSLEFETLRIRGAVNVPVAAKSFEKDIQAVASKSDKPIVFYCNGRTCMKSYLAARKAAAVGVKGSYAYDAGMFEWAQAYPEHAELLGKSPVNPANIISRDKFKQHVLAPHEFGDAASSMGANSLIIDVRDKYQRGAAGLFPGMERWASLDDRQKIKQYIETAKNENKTLFVYDEVGKQVRWLQYALEEAQLDTYYFMHEGAKAYYDEMMKSFRTN
ncbi:MAG: rhodanese-like domain-containing protein [Thiohalophilus sp.]|jgi:rhodanese-related sulfurtransferase